MKYRDIIKQVEADGWTLVKQKGSHRQYKHSVKPGKVTIAPHSLNDDIPIMVLNSIRRQV